MDEMSEIVEAHSLELTLKLSGEEGGWFLAVSSLYKEVAA